jgi:hypothetical protein
MARARGRRRHEEGAPGGKLARELFLSRCGGGGAERGALYSKCSNENGRNGERRSQTAIAIEARFRPVTPAFLRPVFLIRTAQVRRAHLNAESRGRRHAAACPSRAFLVRQCKASISSRHRSLAPAGRRARPHATAASFVEAGAIGVQSARTSDKESAYHLGGVEALAASNGRSACVRSVVHAAVLAFVAPAGRARLATLPPGFVAAETGENASSGIGVERGALGGATGLGRALGPVGPPAAGRALVVVAA